MWWSKDQFEKIMPRKKHVAVAQAISQKGIQVCEGERGGGKSVRQMIKNVAKEILDMARRD